MVRQDDLAPLHVEVGGIHVWARSVRGKARVENQDAWSIVAPRASWWGPAGGLWDGETVDQGPAGGAGVVAAVFDGLGGHANGRAAARGAAQALPGLVASGGSGRALLQRLDEVVRDTGGATTAVVGFVRGDALRLVSVGDSAAYVLDGGGRLRRVNALDRSGRHELSACLGVGKGAGHEYDLELGSGVVLTTDGVDEVVPLARDWGPLLSGGVHVMKRLMADLFDSVARAGAPDNATVVVIRP